MPKFQERVTEQFIELFSEQVQIEVEVAPEWMRRPGKYELGDGWPLASAVYGELTGLVLPDVAPPREHRRLDMVLTYSDGTKRVFEFDEIQHFTGARAQTLSFYGEFEVAFDSQGWLARSVALTGREPGGGFGVMKPPLFPEDGGRHQQRAFRDFLADYMPSLRESWLPTARLHYVEAGTALGSASPGDELAKLWNQRTGESLGHRESKPSEPLTIQEWWPLVNRAIRSRLIDATFSPLAQYSLGEIEKVGGPASDSDYWMRYPDDTDAYLPSEAITWIAGQAEEGSRQLNPGPDPRAAYFRRSWPRRQP
ncbi:hypothetical protein [Subtercola lobariae]|uniref:Uncharacterized protein n=1 Tax=Subtercola lobariae TaxID=1588641 RepID=A0A917ETU9_9MICO|nr:hypothetical protein [Subtercola lobariae]GGF15199.1 hypothetical protein GCM10011399_06320 [Subtercola lobariae]